jgi:hypothetical protein
MSEIPRLSGTLILQQPRHGSLEVTFEPDEDFPPFKLVNRTLLPNEVIRIEHVVMPVDLT